MKRLIDRAAGAILLGGALVFAMPAQAVLIADIDFSEVPLLTPDPTIDGLAFSANSGAFFADTITDDFISLGNPYLVAGLDDLPTNFLPGLIETPLVNVAGGGGGAGLITTVSVDAGFFTALPSGEEIVMELLLGGAVQGSDSVVLTNADDGTYSPLQVILDELAFDAMRFYVDTDLGDFFRIDNLQVDVTDKQGPAPIPAPPTLVLLGVGLGGLLAARHRRAR